MRGTPARPRARRCSDRIIPAHAGNSVGRTKPSAPPPDHPRACGELASVILHSTSTIGSSPRMRGTRGMGWWSRSTGRIIPAHAGNSAQLSYRWRRCPDHPRACGELRRLGSCTRSTPGSSPRMRGTRLETGRAVNQRRIIPAHAGNSRATPAAGPGRPDHPRACGELSTSASRPVSPLGSSPRMRGTRSRTTAILSSLRIIPAHAGNSRASTGARHSTSDHPRACGEL